MVYFRKIWAIVLVTSVEVLIVAETEITKSPN